MSTYVAVFALVLAYVALVVAWLAVRALSRVRRSLASGERIVERQVVERPARLPDELLETTRRTAALSGSLAHQLADLRAHVDATAAQTLEWVEARMPDPSGALCNVALVRYDAFGEMSGRMSFSLALLDDKGDGVAITAIAGTGSTSVYAKGVRGGSGEHDLSPEEAQAVSTALHRPRTRLLGRRAS